MNAQFMEIILFVTTVLSGFYAGAGFFVFMGGNPSVKLMSDHTFAEFWQHTDHFMAARMKIFGPLLLLLMTTATLLLIKEWHTPAFWFMLAGTLILIADTIFVFNINHPLNLLIQSWDLNKLPGNVQEIKWKVVNAFNGRMFFMMSSFIMVLLAVWLRKGR